MLNIVINGLQAIGATEAGSGRLGTLTVRSWPDAHDVVVSIGNTGAAIPPEIRNRIFDPFFTTKVVGAGSGQGLSIAYSIVRRHGGALTLGSALGAGTIFFIRLPIDGRRRGEE